MGGYIWKFAEEEYYINLSEHKRKLPKARKISIIKNKYYLGEFDSLREAELKTEISRTKLSESLKSGIEINGIQVTYSEK
jgi:hypothetical protein